MSNYYPTSHDANPEREALTESRDALASAFHEDWRRTRLQEDGSYEPREKQTTDLSWIEAHGGVDVVDIANTEYDGLPEDWQAENRAAADVVMGVLIEYDGFVPLNREEERNRVGDIVHHAWLGRNDWARGGDLDKPFWQLPWEEQEKDINQIAIGMQLWAHDSLQKKADQGYGDDELSPYREALDDIRHAVRMDEIVRQENEPERISVPLRQAEVAREAEGMIDSLYKAVQAWGVEPEIAVRGTKSYQTYRLSLGQLRGDSDPTQISVLFGSDLQSTSPQLAQVIRYYFEHPEAQWPRETFVDLRSDTEKPRIHVVDYPYHEEDLGRPDTNTDTAAAQAKSIVSEVPGA